MNDPMAFPGIVPEVSACTSGDVTIVDCGIGNVRSVRRMFEAVEASVDVVSRPADIGACRRLVLPGVGAFDAGMAALREGGWIDPLNRLVEERRVPVLGICLGMQLLCRDSEEGRTPGLGWLDASVVRLETRGDPRLKVPHMGWSAAHVAKDNPILPSDGDEQRFYFVHKYRVHCDRPEDVLATATYGEPFTCAVQRDNVFGVQFHPEKSHRYGMALMQRFATL